MPFENGRIWIVPIPDHFDGMLPPIVCPPGQEHTPQSRAPFQASVVEVAARLGTSEMRRTILTGFLDWRKHLADLGFVSGFQWLDGSFVDMRPTEPRDIDVVTFFHRPAGVDDSGLGTILRANLDVFDKIKTKPNFHCDVYWIDLDAADPVGLVESVAYWHGLLSHSRERRWRGFLEVPLGTDDQPAREMLALMSEMAE